MDKFAEKIAKFTNSKYMRILTNGFMSVAAVSICGSIFSLLKSLPITAYQNFLTSSGLGDILAIPVAVCSDVIALYVVLSMGYNLAKEFGYKKPFAAAIVALGAFFVLTPFSASSYSVAEDGSYIVETVDNVLGTGITGALGARGIFLAIITGLLASRLYLFFIEKDIKIKLPDTVPDNVSGMFEMMIPGGLTFLAFLVVRWLCSLTPFGSAQTLIYTLLQLPLMSVGGGLFGALAYVTVAKFLWCFGVHGGMVAYSALAAVMSVANAANASAFAAGTAAPYPEWALTTSLMDFSVLPLAIAMLIVCKSDQYKALSKIALPTSIFNISEPLVFGIPIIMNVLICIPFVLLQPFNLLLTLLMIKIGVVAAPTGVAVSSVLPTPIALALINSSWTGAVWSIVLIIINVLIWIPFVKRLDNKALVQENATVTE